MVRAGISKHVAKRISGHTTNSIFDRYDITDETDLADAARKLEARNGHNWHGKVSKPLNTAFPTACTVGL